MTLLTIMTSQELNQLNNQIIKCKKCPRLSNYITNISLKKIKRFKEQNYWGKPLPGFGNVNAQLLIVGLAPAAHGGNRTGRMFTGDSSGDWLSKVLYKHGFASKSSSLYVNDGFELINAYITAVVRCAPPQNKPQKDELDNCSAYLIKEFFLLRNIKVVLCLGKIAFDSCCKILEIKGRKFYHGNFFKHEKLVIVSSYHPSRQNTQTGRLTWNQWNQIFKKVRKMLGENTF